MAKPDKQKMLEEARQYAERMQRLDWYRYSEHAEIYRKIGAPDSEEFKRWWAREVTNG